MMGRLSEALANLLWRKVFAPHNRRLFALRIWLRVRWLLLGLWWREDVSFRAVILAFPRPIAVLLLGIGLPLMTFWLAREWGWLAAIAPAKAGFTLPAVVDWRAAVQPLLLFIGLPAAFILWAFRDHNVQMTLANQRKDVNLKEFQEIQLRAAGALDEKLPAEAREQLQIAALHQLRGFLRGDFGRDFRRPAFELLLAGHKASMERIGLARALADWRKGEPAPATIGQAIDAAMADCQDRRTAVDRARLAVMAADWPRVMRARFPLEGRDFDGLRMPPGALLADLDLSQTSWHGADLSYAHFEGAKLSHMHLEGANLWNAYLESADLRHAHLEGADMRLVHLEASDLRFAHLKGAKLQSAHLQCANLSLAHLKGAKLRHANLEGADLQSADIEGAELTFAHLKGADLRGARFDDDTKLLDEWSRCSAQDRAKAQQKLRDLGARHVNDPEKAKNAIP